MNDSYPRPTEPMRSAIQTQLAVTAAEASTVHRKDFAISRSLPEPLADLDRLSQNFAWSWLAGGVDIFRDIDPQLWDECEQNPRLLLARSPEIRLAQCAADPDYLARLTEFASRLDAYLAETPASAGAVTAVNPAAYFCAEYGVHNSLPIYSGGLGILAGDHLKSASDMNVPLVAVGLLYRFGYFRQNISHEGWQKESYQDIFAGEAALEPVLSADGTPETVLLHIRGREVQAMAWLARVGRIKLYLLDTDLEANNEVDRMITAHLYGGDSETRIVQEKVLGIGGVRLLRKLGMAPSVYHLNEGHSAFLTLELAREFLANSPDADFKAAGATIREKCVFTTHTPVDAGNDAFDPETLQACFTGEYIDSLKLTRDEFLDLGRTDPTNDSEFFGMTPLALRMCRSANGVSEKHGEVSRKLWLKMFPELVDATAVPITHVTNGVHPPTWVAPVLQDLFRRTIGDDWPAISHDAEKWKAAVQAIPDAEIWAAHRKLKELLVAFVRTRTAAAETGESDTINEHRDTARLFSPDVLTIGFARRVAAYKRWDLLVSDLDRLLRIVDDPDRPVQFVFAGKAHPQDRTAKEILQNLMSINHDSGWQNRAVFIQDYDQEIARHLVHGVDVWMNVPRRPLEASGTSGIKAAMNGVLNFSVLDGWWIEGYNEVNGFAIGGLGPEGESAEIDAADAEALYSTLENDIIPAFHDTGESGLPDKWIARMKDSIATLTPMFSSDRMVADYLHRIYNT